ncbi:MAG: hypothetical protein RL078_1794 [Bacteroidota bacterium]
MNPLDIRKRLKHFSKKMSSNSPLTQEEYTFLASAFSRIADGEDANEVFGVQFKRGKSIADAEKRQAISFVIQWIECAIQPVDAEVPGLGYSTTKACEEAAPILRKILGEEQSEKYDAEYIRQCYYSPKYKHMRSEFRGIYEDDSPFQP